MDSYRNPAGVVVGHWDEKNAYRVKLLGESEAGFCFNNSSRVSFMGSLGVPLGFL